MKITALTSFCVDIFPELDRYVVGGNSLNFAVQCQLLGHSHTSVIGAVGKDAYGAQIKDQLSRFAIDCSRLYQLNAPTASNRIFIDENGDRYFKEGSWNGGAFDAFRLSEEDWNSLADSDLIAMPGGDPNLSELLKMRHDHQLVAIDFLDYLGLDFIRQHCEAIDIIFLSARETMLNDLQELSNQQNKLVVATLGAKGSIAFFNNQRYEQQAIAVDNIVDTTGCGDAFQAAFSTEWLSTKNIPKALKAGAVAARNVLGFVGGVPQG